MRKISKSTVLLIIIFVIGLSLILYPTVSDYWNSLHQSRAISRYTESVDDLDKEKYAWLLEQAEGFNASLVGNGNRFVPTEEEKEYYLSLLGSDGAAVGYIEINAIRLSLPIYLGSSESVLQDGVGTMEGTSIPIGGESTHSVLTGHRGLPSATLFTNLNQLVEGDLFTIHILNNTVTYEVDQILIVEPQNFDELAIEEGNEYCTLLTCTPYGINSHRVLVRGHRVGDPGDAVSLRISADAIQIEPLIFAPMVALPILLFLLVRLLSGKADKFSVEQSATAPGKGKKGGHYRGNRRS